MRAGKMAWHKLRHQGSIEFGIYAARKAFELVFRPTCACAGFCADYVSGRRGFEIGGSSQIFGDEGYIPVYRHASTVDGINFAARTVWAQSLGEDDPFVHKGRTLGRQFVREASDLIHIPSASYDFGLSSHVIEHLANPIAGLREWMRILKDGGLLILVVPHKDATFDHRRPVTTLAHLQEDFARDVREDDSTHISEVLEFHDFSRDWGAGDREAFQRRCEDNANTRCVHHHVFDTELVVALVDSVGLAILAVEHAWPNNIVVVCQKTRADSAADNAGYLGIDANWRRQSPFRTDRRE